MSTLFTLDLVLVMIRGKLLTNLGTVEGGASMGRLMRLLPTIKFTITDLR